MQVVAGIDIGGTNTVLGLVCRSGEIVAQSTIGTNWAETFDEFVDVISAELHLLLSSQPANTVLLGVGIGAPNGSYRLGALIDPPNLRWKGRLELCSRLNQVTGLRALLTNDANAAALGEHQFGAARGMHNFAVVTLGTGLGCGIVLNDKLYQGHDGFAGELGHVTVARHGRRCGCGKRGCLETYASATGLRRTVFELLSNSLEPSVLRNISYEELTSKTIDEAALAGDAIALAAFEETGRYLGESLANVVALLNPEAIVLFGGLAQAGALILEPTRKHLEATLFPVFRGRTKLLLSGLTQPNAAVLGAAALMWNEL